MVTLLDVIALTVLLPPRRVRTHHENWAVHAAQVRLQAALDALAARLLMVVLPHHQHVSPFDASVINNFS